MHRVDLSERVKAVERNFVLRANIALKGGRAGERAAECTARVRKVGPERTKVDGCSISPQKDGLPDRFALIPGGARRQRGNPATRCSTAARPQ